MLTVRWSNQEPREAKNITTAVNLITQLIQWMYARQHAQTETSNLWFVNTALIFANAATFNKIFSSNRTALD